MFVSKTLSGLLYRRLTDRFLPLLLRLHSEAWMGCLLQVSGYNWSWARCYKLVSGSGEQPSYYLVESSVF